MNGCVVETQPRPNVVLLTLNRPERRNALTLAMMGNLADALRDLSGRPGARAVVLTGAPPAFCAGGDLRELRDGDASHYRSYCEAYRTIAEAIRGLRGPLIAAVNGAAVAGGLELACLADLRLASAAAFFAGGDARLGLPTTSGLSWILPRLIGVGRARRLLYGDGRIDAAEALRIGLAEEVHPAAELLDRALDLAVEIAAMPGDGIELTRRLIDQGLTTSHAEAIEAELLAQARAYADPAVRAAFEAFLAR